MDEREKTKSLEESRFRNDYDNEQCLISKKIIILEDDKNFNDLFFKILEQINVNILDVFYYPHARNENFNFMKLNTGIINQTLHKYFCIDLKSKEILYLILCRLLKTLIFTFYRINIQY